MLEQLTLPIDYEDFEAKDSEVSVAFTVTDPGNWVPTNPNDRTWDETFKKMVQVQFIYFILVITSLHQRV